MVCGVRLDSRLPISVGGIFIVLSSERSTINVRNFDHPALTPGPDHTGCGLLSADY